MARILVIDDNETNLRLAVYLLRRFTHNAKGVFNADFGLEMAQTEPFDVILVDLQMPGMDGFEFLSRVREHPTARLVPVIALTAHAMIGDRERVLAAGFDDYISKPIDPESFASQIEDFLLRKPFKKTLHP